jgi:ribosomal protein S18 acetylase RimI-like enzyme
MTAPDEEIRRLEILADRAWPPAEVQVRDGWELRVSEPGIGRRVNSVAPREAGRRPLEEKVAQAEAFYRHRGLTPTLKLTAAARPAGLDEFLAGRGYRSEAEVSIQTLSLTVPAAAPRLPAVPSPAWLEANAAVPSHYGAAPDAFLALIGRIDAPTGFAAVERDGQVAAIGMAVAEEGAVGIFEIGTRPEYRRRGLAREVMRTLLAWGAAGGASTAYLQVMLQNTPARSLYQALGFTEAYRYWYRIAP